MSEEETKSKSEIIPAETGPKHADRKGTYHVADCIGCGTEVYFFKTERWSSCFKCGAWTEKPKNGKAMSI